MTAALCLDWAASSSMRHSFLCPTAADSPSLGSSSSTLRVVAALSSGRLSGRVSRSAGWSSSRLAVLPSWPGAARLSSESRRRKPRPAPAAAPDALAAASKPEPGLAVAACPQLLCLVLSLPRPAGPAPPVGASSRWPVTSLPRPSLAAARPCLAGPSAPQLSSPPGSSSSSPAGCRRRRRRRRRMPKPACAVAGLRSLSGRRRRSRSRRRCG